MQTKALPAHIKASTEGDEGVFEAIVATYDVDSVKDQIMPGAFTDTLATWEKSGAPIPVIWSHKADDPECHIGWVEKAEERPEGLWVQGRLDMDDPKSRKVHRLFKGNRIRNFSFAYDIDEARPSEKAEGVQELHRLTLHEVGPCLIGANRATSLLGVKQEPMTTTMTSSAPITITYTAGDPNVTLTRNQARAAMGLPPVDETKTAVDAVTKISDTAAELKSGRVLSKQNEELVEQIHSLAAQLLAAVKGDPVETSAEKATPIEPADTPASQVADPAAPETKNVEPADSGTASSSRIRSLDLWLMELEADADMHEGDAL